MSLYKVSVILWALQPEAANEGEQVRFSLLAMSRHVKAPFECHTPFLAFSFLEGIQDLRQRPPLLPQAISLAVQSFRPCFWTLPAL